MAGKRGFKMLNQVRNWSFMIMCNQNNYVFQLWNHGAQIPEPIRWQADKRGIESFLRVHLCPVLFAIFSSAWLGRPWCLWASDLKLTQPWQNGVGGTAIFAVLQCQWRVQSIKVNKSENTKHKEKCWSKLAFNTFYRGRDEYGQNERIKGEIER